MAKSVLEKDQNIRFPHFTVLKASAGSGKTYTLTERFVQFVLSDKIPRNRLKNILAITFSNNASKEMKERVLLWLKTLYFGDEDTLDELSRIVTMDKERMRTRAGEIIDEILSHYSDFQVRTIDSFMATIFRASAIDFGLSPEFEILMDPGTVMEYAFSLFLRDVKEGTPLAELFEGIIRIILEQRREGSSYPWDPSKDLLTEIKKLYRKLASTAEKLRIEDLSDHEQKVKREIRERLEMLEQTILRSGLERNAKSTFPAVLSLVREEKFSDLIGKGLKTSPVKKPPKKMKTAEELYDGICQEWEEAGKWINQYTSCYARSYFSPYLRVFEAFRDPVERVKVNQGIVFIEDINQKLSEYLSAFIIPDIYFRMGETIFHFLIDEFQDTSSIQWSNLLPLIENSLSQGGSLFVVGDTKQAIYGFRDADYTVMKASESVNPFPSSEHHVLELETNYRSLPRILEFTEKVFKEIGAAHEKYGEAILQSGLGDYIQRPRDGVKHPGYVEVKLVEKNEDDPPEKRKIQKVIEELRQRGYQYKDIALLTAKNEDVVKASGWLNEKSIPFVSYSNLDIRRRRITGEILSLLAFLDVPPDDLSFATFLLGEIFEGVLSRSSNGPGKEALHRFLFQSRNNSPLYKAFQLEFGDLWDRHFLELFRSSGYLPLYDLVNGIFRTFNLFELLPGEEATLVKILEAVKEFEGTGYNSLRDFLGSATDGETAGREWNIDVPRGLDAVRVMTVHKAKGLGFPVVIALLYGERSRGFGYIVHKEEGEALLLKINQKIAGCDPLFEKLYEEEARKEMVSRLNSLYVEFTRAKEELYVVGVQGREGLFPFDLLPAEDYPPSKKPEKTSEGSEYQERLCPVSYYPGPIRLSPSPEGRISLEERRRGDFIHAVLSHVVFVGEDFKDAFRPVIREVCRVMREEYDEEEIAGLIAAMLEAPEVKEYFEEKSGRTVKNEQSFSDREGRLFRMDRLVIDKDEITVIDYKTGKERGAETGHEAQMRNYMKILWEVYPGKGVSGILAYVDLQESRRVL